MHLVSLLIRLCYRLYGRMVRELEYRAVSKEPPSPHTALLVLLLYTVYNCLSDNLVNHFVVISSTYYANSSL